MPSDEGYETILVEKRGQVDWVTLSRPQSLNAINFVMNQELGRYFDGLFADPSVRIVVLRGAGEMLETSPLGLRLTKEGLWAAVDATSLQAAMAIENRNQRLCDHDPDHAEAVRAFLEKRKPSYAPPRPI